MPRLIVVAGVNGSGKSTLTQAKRFNNVGVIDPDAIAKEMTNSLAASARIVGGKEAIKRRREYLAAKKSFVLETTLSGRSTLRFIGKARQMGYEIELHYIYLIDVEQSADRVKTRVSKGGHNIPKQDLVRRFERSRDNFEDAALISDRIVVYDNAGIDAIFQTVMDAQSKKIEFAQQAPEWLMESIGNIRNRARQMGGHAKLFWCDG